MIKFKLTSCNVNIFLVPLCVNERPIVRPKNITPLAPPSG